MTTELRDAVSGAIEEAILRVTDGSVTFTDEQLRRIGDEFLYGEKTFGQYASIEPSTRTARILVHERFVPPANRRPAPREAELWDAHPELFRRQVEHATDEDPHERLWALVAQPTYSPDTPFEELPARILRQCCQHKSCGGTDLYLHQKDSLHGPYYSYRRSGNDDVHFGASSVGGLVAQLNDPSWWPNQHSDVWGYVGKDGVDANAPTG